MSNSEPKYFGNWPGPLLPTEAYYQHYSPKEGWEARQEYVIQTDLRERVRITIENAPHGIYATELGRADELAENNIWDLEHDTKYLAERLMETLFYHMSDFELMHIMNKMAERCRIDQDFTKEFYATIATTQPLPECGGQHEDEGKEGLQSS